MSIIIDEDESFSMQAYVESPGYVRTILKGYLVSRRGDETYVAPLIPQLFYGADGVQLQTWRQFIPAAGSQTILSRSAGKPKVPREELFWRRVDSMEREQRQTAPSVTPEPVQAQAAVSPAVIAFPLAVGAVLLLFFLRK